MSVVNTMLRELADRQLQAPTLASVASLPVQTAPAPRHDGWYWLAAVVLLASAIFFWRWQQQSPDRGSTAATVPAKQEALSPSPPASESVPAVLSNTAPAPIPTAKATPTLAATNKPATALTAKPITAIPITTTQAVASQARAPQENNAVSIGWELVTPAADEFNEPLPDDSDADADTDNNATAAVSAASPPAAASVFERQPAQQTPAEQLTQLRQQARNAVIAGDWRGADALIRTGLQLNAEDNELLLLQLQNDAGQEPLAAIARAEALLQHQPGNWPVRQWLGSQRLQQQQAAEALSVLQQSAPTLSEAPDYHAVLALAEQQSGAHAAAVARYRSLAALQPEHGRHYAGLALSLEPLGDTVGAINAWRSALRDPQLAGAVAEYGRQRLQHLLSSLNKQASP